MNFYNIIAKLMNKFLFLETIIKRSRSLVPKIPNIFNLFNYIDEEKLRIHVTRNNYIIPYKKLRRSKSLFYYLSQREGSLLLSFMCTLSLVISIDSLDYHRIQRHVSRSLNPSVVNAVVYHYIRCLIKKEIYFGSV